MYICTLDALSIIWLFSVLNLLTSADCSDSAYKLFYSNKWTIYAVFKYILMTVATVIHIANICNICNKVANKWKLSHR